jgi:Flp pilus assembly protein TadG
MISRTKDSISATDGFAGRSSHRTGNLPLHLGGFRRGGAVLETCLVISLLISLSLGAAEYGYAMFLKHSLMAATTVGLRTAILSNSTDAAVQSAVATQMAMNGLQSIPYTLTTVPTSINNATAGTYVTVTVSCTWGSTGVNTLPVSMGGFAANKIFSTSATMVHE